MTVRDPITGKFVKGVSGNPAGRPKREVEADYLNAMMGQVSLEDWRAITKKAVDQAKRGDSTARKWLSDYLMGTPVQKSEISGDGSELIFRIIRE